ncbi:MAG TPA: TIGR04283 family arsenosugar biosynthesis glycosyltransferase [Vicinamibacteria bacterium]|jgi:rSAM/selenodomain-associated transferase 2
MTPDAICVVIPALDEEDTLAASIRSVREEAEVLVVDGGSRDRTCEVAVLEGARVLTAPAGRGPQLERGAREARGEWIVFLHADTRLERGWAAALRALDGATVGGAFRFAVDSPRPAFRLLERAVAARCRLFRLPYGDQAIFVRRGVYGITGGVPPIPLMEDVAFVRRLRRRGRLAFPASRALTSPRRWERRGIVATTVQNLWLFTQYLAGVAPERLAGRYHPRS